MRMQKIGGHWEKGTAEKGKRKVQAMALVMVARGTILMPPSDWISLNVRLRHLAQTVSDSEIEVKDPISLCVSDISSDCLS